MNYGKFNQPGGGGVRRPDGGNYNQGGPQRGQDRSQPDQTIASLWPGYLSASGYFDEAGNLDPQYVARCIPGDELQPDHKQRGVEPLIHAMTQARPSLTTGQLRRFFSHARALETKLKTGSATWGQLRAEFQKLDVAAADAHGKSPQKIPGLFYDFIRRNVAAVKTEKDFLQGFLPHFEALVGFGSLYLQKDRN